MINKFSFNSAFLMTLCSIVIALSGLLFGYDTGNIASILIFLPSTFHLSTVTYEFIVSITVFGAFIAALAAPRLTDYFSRKKMLVVCAALFILAVFISSYAISSNMLLVARFLFGIAIGTTAFLAPMYIAELSPPEHRGKYIVINGICITGGECLAYIAGLHYSATENWRMMFYIGIYPAFALFIFSLMLPHSPRWLLLKNKKEKAVKTLKLLRNSDVQQEIDEILKANWQTSKQNISSLLRGNKQVIKTGAVLGCLQQLFGINILLYYGPYLLKDTHLISSGYGAISTTLIFGLVNFFMTIICIFLVDRVGRLKCLYAGSIFAGVSMLAISILFHYLGRLDVKYFILFFMLTFVASYCLSLGTLFWVIISEIFPVKIRATAMGISSAIQWLTNFLISISFLTLLKHFGTEAVFAGCALCCFFTVFFCRKNIPETRYKTLESISSGSLLPKDGKVVKEL